MKRKLTEEMMRKDKKYLPLLAEQEFLRDRQAIREIERIKAERKKSPPPKLKRPQCIEVVAALIRDPDGRYLVGQRAADKSQGGLWEFMGGKIEPGETPEVALARECREELALEIENERIVDAVVHDYPDKTIRLTLIACTPKPGSVPTALEHQAIRWVTPKEMKAMPFCPADVELIDRMAAVRAPRRSV